VLRPVILQETTVYVDYGQEFKRRKTDARIRDEHGEVIALHISLAIKKKN
jgi:hypothetical protein